jgi:phytoene dehydrogenase-like protein
VEALMPSDRVVIVGGGHNGLVAAFYLAKAGFSPLVLERREIVGGIAVTEEIHPGFRCPILAHSAGPLLPSVSRDMALATHGLEVLRPDVQLIALHPEHAPLRIYEDPQRTARELAAISATDAKRYPEFDATFRRLGHTLAPLLSVTPWDIDDLKLRDYFDAGKLGLKFRGLDKRDAYRLLRWGPMAVADLADEWFDSDLIRAIIAARGIFGSGAGPRSAGTSIGLLMQAAFGGNAFGVRGGTGALTQAMSKAAAAAGAEIRTGAQVTRIQVKDGKATAVVLESGEEIPARAVVSNADPQQTYLKLIERTELEPSFLMKVRAYRAVGTVAKINFALSGLPTFNGARGAGDISGRIHIAPDMDYIEHAYDAAKYGDFSPRPYLDITIPSLGDPSLAPNGAHVMSVHVQYAPYRLSDGDWQTRRSDLAETVVQTLSMYASNFGELVVHRQVLTPFDLEQTFALSGGHMFHGEHSLDQLFSFRPFLGWAQYRTPIQRLYLCGAGTHPGGGLTGAPGANASREIIKDLRQS